MRIVHASCTAKAIVTGENELIYGQMEEMYQTIRGEVDVDNKKK